MTTELEKALQEIERLRQENAQLRKTLGIEVSEPNADYSQSRRPSVGSDTMVEETEEARSYGGHGVSIFARMPGVDSNFSTGEKIKLFRGLSGGERMFTQSSGSTNEPERRVTHQPARIHGVRRREKQRSISL